MAYKMISVKCPDCGATMEIESGREFAFCTYCGSKVMVSNENEYVYRHVDEARIREDETERMIRLREIELQEKENERERKASAIAYGIALASVAIGAIVSIWQPVGGLWGFIIGAYIAMFNFIRNNNKKKNTRRYVGSNSALISDDLMNYRDQNYAGVVMKFRAAGFTNVTAVSLRNVGFFNMYKNGLVDSVTINGSGAFEEGDVFPKNSVVLVHYHGK